MKKVLHYKTNYLNPSETFIDRLVRNHQNWTAAALCYRKREFCDGLTVFEVPDSGFSALINTASFHLNRPLPFYRDIVFDIKPDLIHSHFGFDGYKLINIAKESGIPLIVSFYGSDVSRLPTELGWKRRYQKLAKSASHFIAASAFMKSKLIDLGFPENAITIVRFGLDLDKHRFEEGSRHPLSLILAGRLVEKKGFEFALRAIAASKNRGHNWKADLYGDGPLLESVKNLVIELGLNDSVQFHGFQPVETILDALRNHTLLLAPSVTASDGDMEGLPNTILEAMAAGTPVITTRHAAIPEAIIHEKSGFLADQRDTKELGLILDRIANGETNLGKIRRNARKIIEEQYSIDKMVQNVEKVYDRVIADA
ncbi:MAG: glycosyltransferase [Balneolaceae bacterium]|nr:glycosyltransferase [Balneolaceae bacterium]